MHYLTKVLIVLAAMLSVLLSALVMAFTANADALTRGYRSEQARRLRAEADLSAQATRWGNERTSLLSQVDKLENELAARDVQIRQLQAEAAALRTDKRAAELAAESIKNQIGGLAQTAQMQAALISSYRDEITGLRAAELRFRRREIDLLDRINDLESQNEVQAQTVRALEEQLAEMRLAMERGPAGAEFAATRPFIRGRVVETLQDQATGKTLVRIDVGTNDQVHEDMRLHVLRGNSWLADLRVVDADLNWAIAEVEFKREESVRLQSDDLVLSRLR